MISNNSWSEIPAHAAPILHISPGADTLLQFRVKANVIEYVRAGIPNEHWRSSLVEVRYLVTCPLTLRFR